MDTIYSHMGINENELNEKYETILDTGEIHKYSIKYQLIYVVNMPFIGQGEGKGNKCGWLRNKNYFFKNLLKVNPEIFSELNKLNIMEGNSPSVDKTFISFFPEYSDFINEKLLHHHIGEDGQAIALPTSLHKGYGVVHNSEKIIGITENGIKFSNIVQEDFAAGKIFDWRNANDIMDDVLINKLYDEIKLEENDNLKEDTKTQVINRYDTKTVFNDGGSFIKNIKLKDILIVGLLMSAATGVVIATKKAGGIGKLTEAINKSLSSSFMGISENKNILSLEKPDINTGTEIIDKASEVFSVVKGTSEVVKDSMDDVSVFRSIFSQFKDGSISKSELIEKSAEISKMTGKSLSKYLRLLKNFKGDNDASRALQ